MSDGPRHSTLIVLFAALTSTAARPPSRHGSYTVDPLTAAVPKASQMSCSASWPPIPPSFAPSSR